MNQKVVKQIVVGIVALVLMVLLSACAGVGTTPSGGVSLSGQIVSVDTVNHTVTILVNGQSKTIKNVPNNILTALQSQVGKPYTFTVTQNPDGSYNIQAGTNVTPEANETPNGEGTPGQPEPGSIEFIGSVTSSGNGSITVSMPDGSSLTASTAGADLGDFNGSVPATGTRVKVEVTATNGSFTATKLSMSKADDDASIVKFQGVTTQAVGSDRVIHFGVGNKSYTFTIPSTVDLSDFGGTIASGATVKVTVQYSGTTGTVTKVSQ